jgi:uncharacterized membrane protein
MLEDWVARLAEDLGFDPVDVSVDEVLGLAKDAAHTVARPAAPLTTFLVGYAAGLKGGGRETLEETLRTALSAIAAEGARLDSTD